VGRSADLLDVPTAIKEKKGEREKCAEWHSEDLRELTPYRSGGKGKSEAEGHRLARHTIYGRGDKGERGCAVCAREDLRDLPTSMERRS
jgi:hypothetical protein